MLAVRQLAFFGGGGSHILWIKTSKMKITKTSVPLVLFMAVQFGSPPVARFGDIDYTLTSWHTSQLCCCGLASRRFNGRSLWIPCYDRRLISISFVGLLSPLPMCQGFLEQSGELYNSHRVSFGWLPCWGTMMKFLGQHTWNLLGSVGTGV